MKEIMKDLCTNCEKETEMEVIIREETIKVRQDNITIPIHYLRCKECSDEIISPIYGEDPFALAYKTYRKKHDLLTPEEIKSYRESLGLTQMELAKLVGIGIATLSRYENGALQDQSHENLLRLAKDPVNMLKLIEKSEQVFSDSRKNTLIQSISDLQESALSFDRAIEVLFSRDEPSIFNGYTKPNLSKLYNAILYFCKNGVWKTKLNKLLFYADFKHFKDFSISITGMKYAHLPFGPCPDKYEFVLSLLSSNNLVSSEEVIFDNGDGGERIHAQQEPDLNVFSASELHIIAFVQKHFESFSAGDISVVSHSEEAYEKTDQRDLISYSYATSLKL